MYAQPGPTPPDERDRFGKTFRSPTRGPCAQTPLRSYTRCADGFGGEPDHSTIWRQKDALAAQSIIAIRLTAYEVPSEESVIGGTMERNQTEQPMETGALPRSSSPPHGRYWCLAPPLGGHDFRISPGGVSRPDRQVS
jgi:hypothetical protein